MESKFKVKFGKAFAQVMGTKCSYRSLQGCGFSACFSGHSCSWGHLAPLQWVLAPATQHMTPSTTTWGLGYEHEF